jgi:predicted ArsR family transcriptional regulator
VSTKTLHILKFWRKALIAVCKGKAAATAGEVGKSVGQSRNTAKKYLDLLVKEGVVDVFDGVHINGVITKNYFPIKDERQ